MALIGLDAAARLGCATEIAKLGVATGRPGVFAFGVMADADAGSLKVLDVDAGI